MKNIINTVCYLYSRSWRVTGLAAFCLGLFVSYNLAADRRDDSPLVTRESVIKGEWSAELRQNEKDAIQFSVSRRTERGSHNMSNSNYTFADFSGLNKEMMLAANGTAKFSLPREAGNIECEGVFKNGRGTGLFTLRPNADFLGAMESRGYKLTENDFFAAVIIDVTNSFIADLETSGFKQLSFSDAVKAKIFKITPDYIREMRQLGFAENDLEELVKGRIFKITAEFAREVENAGFGRQPMESLVKMRIFKVTPEFIKEIRDAGVDNPDIETLVKFRIFKINADFIRQAKADGNINVTAEELVRLKIRGRVRETL